MAIHFTWSGEILSNCLAFLLIVSTIKCNQDLYLTDSGTSAYKQLVSVQNNKIVADMWLLSTLLLVTWEYRSKTTRQHNWEC